MPADGDDHRALLDALTAGVWAADGDLRFSTPQVEWERFTGQHWDQHRDRGWLRAFAPDDQPAVDAACVSAAAGAPFVVPARLWHAPSSRYRDVVLRAVRTAAGRYLGAITGDDAQCAGCRRTGDVDRAAVSVLGETESATALRAAVAALNLCAGDVSVVLTVDPAQVLATAGSPGLVDDVVGDRIASRVEGAAAGVRLLVGHRATGAFDAGDERGLSRLALHVSHALRAARRQVAATEGEALAQAALKDAAESLRGKDELMAVLGYELRGSLAPIVTATELLRLRGGSGERERTIISDHMRQLMRLADDLLDVSRIARGTLRLAVEQVDLAAVLTRSVEQALPLLQQRGHELTVDVPQGLRAEVDPTRLAQVFGCLLSRSARSTEPGGRVRLSAARADDAVIVTVADDGTGIAPHLLGRVFDPTDTTSGDRAGLGIALPLVKSLVTMHGGQIDVRSDSRGTAFTVRLPARPSATVRSTAPAARDDVRRVLVVDDNTDAADTMGEALTECGYAVQVAYEGEAALRAFRELPPEVVLLDLGLPDVDGLEVARRMRSAPGGAAAWLVAVTGHGHEHERRRTQEAGFDHHLVKPVNLERLLAWIERAARRG